MTSGDPESVDLTRTVPRLFVSLRTFSDTDQGTWESILDRAELFDRVGIDRLVVSDHVAFGESLDEYSRPEVGGISGGRQPTGPDGHWLEPLTVLAAIAGRTSQIRLGTYILIAALRRPVVLAKTIATLDVLSGGRVDLGVGVGWQKAEYDAAGLLFAKRGHLLDDTLELCSQLWTQDVVQLPNGPIHQMPKPLQAQGVPVWVGGRSTNPRVIERVVRFGTGWIPWGDDAKDPRPGVERLRSAMDAAGRDPRQLQVTGSLPNDHDGFLELLDAGVSEFRVPNGSAGEPELIETVEQFRQWCNSTR